MAATEAILVVLVALAALVPLLRAPELRWRVVGATLLLTIVGSYAAATLLPRSPRAGGEGDPANAHRPRRSLDDGYVSSTPAGRATPCTRAPRTTSSPRGCAATAPA